MKSLGRPKGQKVAGHSLVDVTVKWVCFAIFVLYFYDTLIKRNINKYKIVLQGKAAVCRKAIMR